MKNVSYLLPLNESLSFFYLCLSTSYLIYVLEKLISNIPSKILSNMSLLLYLNLFSVFSTFPYNSKNISLIYLFIPLYSLILFVLLYYSYNMNEIIYYHSLITFTKSFMHKNTINCHSYFNKILIITIYLSILLHHMILYYESYY